LPDRSSKVIAPTTPSGAQLSLIDQADEAGLPEAPAASAQPHQPAAPAHDATRPKPLQPSPAAPPTFRLNAPLRLDPAVRDALASVVHTLNGPGAAAAACAVADGLFIPLQELERRGIQPALAMRALADVSMLVQAQHSRPPTVSRDFRGEATIGLVIDPRCVDGFDLAAFTLPETQGE
jgi:conjugal transfer pilus assembly protein TraI